MNFFDGFGDSDSSNPDMEGLEGQKTRTVTTGIPADVAAIAATYSAYPTQQQNPMPPTTYYGTPPGPTGPAVGFVTETPQEEPELDEAERRLYKASFYRDLLHGQIFDSGNPVTDEVEEECREFYRRRMAEAMAGVTKSGAGLLLTDRRLSVLALMADAVMANPKLQMALGLNSNAVASVPAEAPAPAPAPPQPKKRPTLRGRAPEGTVNVVVPQQARQATPTPKQLPQRQPAPAAAQPPRPAAASPVQAPRPVASGVAPAHDEIVESGGRRYRIKHVDMNSAEYGPQIQSQIEGLPIGGSMVLANGAQILREPDRFVKILQLDLTRQKIDRSTAMPFPTETQMTALTQMRSAEALNVLPKSAKGLAETLSE